MKLSALELYDEDALVSRLAAGDDDAFGQLFEHYHTPLGNFLLRFVKSPELMEDLRQEIFIKIWEQRAKLSGLKSFKAFLYVVARNHTLDILRRASRSEAAKGEIVRQALSQHISGSAEDDILSRQYQVYLEKVINQLSPRSREVFRLCREQEMTYDQVAAELGISRNAVRNYMAHALKFIGSSVEKDLNISLSLFLIIVYRS